jgi:hypothetical protein
MLSNSDSLSYYLVYSLGVAFMNHGDLSSRNLFANEKSSSYTNKENILIF